MSRTRNIFYGFSVSNHIILIKGKYFSFLKFPAHAVTLYDTLTTVKRKLETFKFDSGNLLLSY